MKTTITTILAAVLLFSSCKKEKDPQPETCPNVPTGGSSDMYHFPLTIGSYWIYQEINLDSSFNVTATTGLDSVYISHDTTINGKQYFVKERISLSGGGTSYFFAPASFVRDSAGYQVDPNGKYIRHDDFTNILSAYSNISPPYSSTTRMAHKDSSVTVPAGPFTTIDCLNHVLILDPAYPYNRNRYSHNIMANNVGVIFANTCFYSSPNLMIGVQLARYHIAP
jgi:hypothetical protein